MKIDVEFTLVAGTRRLNYLPEDYHTIVISARTYHDDSYDKVISWIDEHLDGRYYIGTELSCPNWVVHSRFVYEKIVGFELQAELSFFTLACPVSKLAWT